MSVRSLFYLIALLMFCPFSFLEATQEANDLEDESESLTEQESTEPESSTVVPPSKDAQTIPLRPKMVKSFNDVLRDLLKEFAFDLKSKNVPDADHVAVRRVILSENIPSHYQEYVESLIQETYRTNTPFRVVLCPECRVRKKMVRKNKTISVTSVNNSELLDQIANKLGIEVWIDARLIYQVDNLVLSLHFFDQYTKGLIWTKTYESQSIYREYIAEQKAKEAKQDNHASLDKKDLSFSYTSFSIGAWSGVMPNILLNSVFIGPRIAWQEKFYELPLTLSLGLGFRYNTNDLKGQFVDYMGNPENTLDVRVAPNVDDLKPLKMIWVPHMWLEFHLLGLDYKESQRYVSNWYVLMGMGGLLGSGFLTGEFQGGITWLLGNLFRFWGLVGYSIASDIKFKDIFLYKTKGGLSLTLGGGLEF